MDCFVASRPCANASRVPQAMTMPNGVGHMSTGMAHLPSLEQPAEITNLVAAFINDYSNRRAELTAFHFCDGRLDLDRDWS
jgi:hypothetical protein